MSEEDKILVDKFGNRRFYSPKYVRELEKENKELRDIIEKLWKDSPPAAKNFWEVRLGPMKQYFNKQP